MSSYSRRRRSVPDVIVDPYDGRGHFSPRGAAVRRMGATVLGSVAAVAGVALAGAPGASADESGVGSTPDFTVPAGSMFDTAAGADPGFTDFAATDTRPAPLTGGATPAFTAPPDLSDLDSWNHKLIFAPASDPKDPGPGSQVTTQAASSTTSTPVVPAVPSTSTGPLPPAEDTGPKPSDDYVPHPPIVGVSALTGSRPEAEKPRDIYIGNGFNATSVVDPAYAQVPLLAGLDGAKVDDFLSSTYHGVADEEQFRCVVESCLSTLRDLSLSATTPSAEQLRSFFPDATAEELQKARFTNANGYTNVELGCLLVCWKGSAYIDGPLVVGQTGVVDAGAAFRADMHGDCDYVQILHTHPLPVGCKDGGPLSTYPVAGLSEGPGEEADGDVNALRWIGTQLRDDGSAAKAGISSVCVLTGTTCSATLDGNGELHGEWRPGPSGLLNPSAAGSVPESVPTTVTVPHRDDPALPWLFADMNATLGAPTIDPGEGETAESFRARLEQIPQQAEPSPGQGIVDPDGRERSTSSSSPPGPATEGENGRGPVAGGEVIMPPPVDHGLSTILGPNAAQSFPEDSVPSSALTSPDREARYVVPPTPQEERVVLPAPPGFPGRDGSLAGVVEPGVFMTPVGTNDLDYREDQGPVVSSAPGGGAQPSPSPPDRVSSVGSAVAGWWNQQPTVVEAVDESAGGGKRVRFVGGTSAVYGTDGTKMYGDAGTPASMPWWQTSTPEDFVGDLMKAGGFVADPRGAQENSGFSF